MRLNLYDIFQEGTTQPFVLDVIGQGHEPARLIGEAESVARGIWMSTWPIGEVVARSGVPASTIRYYEQIGILPPAQRLNGRRRYDAAILPRLGMIRLAQQAGFTIAEIQTLVHDFPPDSPPSARWQALAQQKLVELEERLQTIRAMKGVLLEILNCHCQTLAECGAATEAE
jgi:MerR family transcriptional regulator, redox-sensitive transcriptional activator SoxR